MTKFSVESLRPGDLVEADSVPPGVTNPQPQKGERGVCFAEAGHYGDGNGPMVRFMNGGVCNVYDGWVIGLTARHGRPPPLKPASSSDGGVVLAAPIAARETLAARLQDELDALNTEAEEGIDDAVWLFERTAAVAQAAISALKGDPTKSGTTTSRLAPDVTP